VSLKDSHKN